MYLSLALFSLGVLSAGFQPILLKTGQLQLLCLSVGLFLMLSRVRPLAGLVLGVIYANWAGLTWMEKVVPESIENEPVMVVGKMVGLPTKLAERVGWRFRFKVSDQGVLANRLLQLSWSDELPPRSGETWSLLVKVKRPYGTVNLRGFDYTAWLLSEGVHGTGSVTAKGATPLALSQSVLGVANIRDHVQQSVLKASDGASAQGLLVALLLGNGNFIPKAIWDALSSTGTNHLFVVSGLHVGLVTGLLYFLALRVFTSNGVSVVIALCGALGYGLITGFGLPIQRALLMSGLGLLILSSNRQFSLWRAYVLAVAAVLVLNPFAGLTVGFWLSFGAVGGLLIGFAGLLRQDQTLLQQLTSAQWIVFVVTLPLLMFWIYKISPISFVTNLIAIPVVTLVIVPLLLLLLLTVMLNLEPIVTWLMELSLMLLDGLQRFLLEMSSHAWQVHYAVGDVEIFFAVIGSLLLLSPKGLLPRWFGGFCWLPLLTAVYTEQDDVIFRLDVLDVGQGLSVLYTDESSTILYDAGIAVGQYDVGAAIVMPALRLRRREAIDLFVVSHGDVDHIGGAASVTNSMPIEQFVFGGQHQTGCRQERRWIFGQTNVVVMPLGQADEESSNNLSCVVLIESAGYKILLPGDIEQEREMALIAGENIQADILVSPHHGSASSSSPAFLNKVDANWVVHSAGFLNRFGHPHQIVQRRYRNRGVQQYNTALDGAVTFIGTAEGLRVVKARHAKKRFWYDAASNLAEDNHD